MMAPTTPTDREQILRVRTKLCALVLGHESVSNDNSEWRTAAHEAGHAMVHLVQGHDFSIMRLYDHKRSPVAGEVQPVWTTIDRDLPVSSRATRVASDLGGALAEELVLGDVEPAGCEQDLRLALARCDIVEPAAVAPGNKGLARVRCQVVRVRAMLLRTKVALAAELRRIRQLDRLACARIVQSAGTRVLSLPRFSVLLERDERENCDRVRVELEQRNAATKGGG